jgi:transposase-like protein
MGLTTVPKPTEHLSSQPQEHQQQLASSGAANETTPRRTRRVFSATDKLRIVKKADACLSSGTRGSLQAMLRQEGIYASTLGDWRTQLADAGLAGLATRKAGRKPKLDAKDLRNAELAKRNAVLERKLHIAEALIDLQKKAHAILGIALPTIDEEN